MKQAQLIPKHRRKRQPTADTMREQLRLAADEIIRLRGEVDAETERARSINEAIGPLRYGSNPPAPQIRKPPPPPNPPPCRIIHRGFLASFAGPEDEFERWKAMPLWRRMFRGRP